MARQYVITEEEMLSLIDQLKLADMERKNDLRGRGPAPDELNRLDTAHWMFHMIVVRWAQAMGFSGFRH